MATPRAPRAATGAASMRASGLARRVAPRNRPPPHAADGRCS
eukprot:CAMPEP_0179336008 /NCGR_PEP_ID=MMETSP0797-20121207/66798_1 /TAXON_ID=47934 /ORGANISM="Dinophysis acuminata, Strain DAEP01" /LENGTH=41 /DNA_ID= /DNA_START= /DNA_END= /DNA_ORIENTATION=